MSGEDRGNAPALVSSGIVLGGILVLLALDVTLTPARVSMCCGHVFAMRPCPLNSAPVSKRRS